MPGRAAAEALAAFQLVAIALQSAHQQPSRRFHALAVGVDLLQLGFGGPSPLLLPATPDESGNLADCEPDLLERIEQWGEVTSRATSQRVEPTRIAWTFPPDPLLLSQLQGLIAAEAECCAFMEFVVVETPEALMVELRVPDDMSEALGALLESVTEWSAPAV